jgi:hypothetical protein
MVDLSIIENSVVILISIRIRICLDLHHFGHFGNLDPQLHQIKIRIRIRIEVISWILNRIRINLQTKSQNVWNMSLFSTFSRV